jgi:hypothetical protein
VTARATEAGSVGAPLAPSGAHAPGELRTMWGVVLGGSLAGDVIIASPEALAIVRAGRLVRAFVLAGIETVRRSIRIGHRIAHLEFGVYRPTF